MAAAASAAKAAAPGLCAKSLSHCPTPARLAVLSAMPKYAPAAVASRHTGASRRIGICRIGLRVEGTRTSCSIARPPRSNAAPGHKSGKLSLDLPVGFHFRQRAAASRFHRPTCPLDLPCPTATPLLPNLPWTTCWVREVGKLAPPGSGGGTGKIGPNSFVWVVALGDHPNDHPRWVLVWVLATGEYPNEYPNEDPGVRPPS